MTHLVSVLRLTKDREGEKSPSIGWFYFIWCPPWVDPSLILKNKRQKKNPFGAVCWRYGRWLLDFISALTAGWNIAWLAAGLSAKCRPHSLRPLSRVKLPPTTMISATQSIKNASLHQQPKHLKSTRPYWYWSGALHNGKSCIRGKGWGGGDWEDEGGLTWNCVVCVCVSVLEGGGE